MSECPLRPPVEYRAQWKRDSASLGLCALCCDFEGEGKGLDQGRGAGSAYGACISVHGCCGSLHSLLSSVAVGAQVLRGSYSSIKKVKQRL